MTKVSKAFLISLALIAAMAVSACKHKPPPPPAVAPPEVQPAPVVQPPPPPQPPVVEQKDFVAPEPAVKSEILPTKLDELNRYVQEKGHIQDAYFGYDESALSSDAQSALSASANWLKENGKYNILIEGHCDERGTEQYNLALGDKRANIAKEYLQTLGVDASRIRTVSYGEERPFDAGHSEASWSKNRRAHLVIVGQ
jgi:peptidoglycan-associated lipoprotein